MDIYSLIEAHALGLEELAAWPEMGALLRQKIARKPRTWLLPVAACRAVGGAAEQAVPAAAAIGCVQVAIILIDDMLDDDPRGEHHRIGAAETANLASAFQAAGLAAVANCDAPAGARLAALNCLNRMMLTTALGQHMDVQNSTGDEAYWRLIRTKSSPYYAAALRAGAVLGGASAETAQAIESLGSLYGEMIQIHDDLNDTLAVPANPDWTRGRLPLPILFAEEVDHPDRPRFRELRRAAAEPEALAEAQTILVRCGAVSYCVDQVLRRYQAAREALAAMQLADRSRLEALVEEAAQPIWELFKKLGTPQPVLPEAVSLA